MDFVPFNPVNTASKKPLPFLGGGCVTRQLIPGDIVTAVCPLGRKRSPHRALHTDPLPSPQCRDIWHWSALGLESRLTQHRVSFCTKNRFPSGFVITLSPSEDESFPSRRKHLRREGAEQGRAIRVEWTAVDHVFSAGRFNLFPLRDELDTPERSPTFGAPLQRTELQQCSVFAV